MSAPDTPPARLDVLTWTLHAEPPAAVDAQADRHARWWFVTSELLGWFGIPFFALAVVPSINDVPTLDPYVLIVASALWLVLALGGVLRFRALRRRTGAPVSAELRDLLEATATLRLSPQEHPHSHRTTATDTRHLLRHLELVTLADQHGWEWLRTGQLRASLQLTLHRSIRAAQQRGSTQ